jgi:predicted transcriptional regulator
MKRNVTFSMDDRALKHLEKLEKKTKKSKSEIIRNGLACYDYLMDKWQDRIDFKIIVDDDNIKK